MPGTLRVIVGHEVVREIAVDGAITVGRRRDNALVLDDESVSGHHGVFEPSGRGYRYVDLGSMNGSLVAAGPRLRKGQSIALDDVTQIMVGKTVLEFRPAADATRAPATRLDATTGALGPGLWGEHDQGQGLIHTPAVQPPEPRAPQRADPQAHASGEGAARGTGGSPATASGASSVEEIDLSGGPRGTGAAPRDASTARPGTSARGDARATAGARPGPPTDFAPARVPAGPAPGHARVVVVLDGQVHALALPSARCVLGRDPRVDLVVPHRSVSEEHAEFCHVDGRWTIRDLWSTNGTRIGVAPVTERRPLRAVSHVIVGAVDVLFVHDGSDDGAPRPTPEGLVRWLRAQRRLSRREGRQVLEECRAQARPVEEVLVRRGLLSPGAALESALAAVADGDAQASGGRWPAWEWALVAALAGAVAWSLLA